MSKYNYEIAKYYVQWNFVGIHCSEKEFDSEEQAVEFAREKYNEGYKTRIQQVRNVVGWC